MDQANEARLRELNEEETNLTEELRSVNEIINRYRNGDRTVTGIDMVRASNRRDAINTRLSELVIELPEMVRDRIAREERENVREEENTPVVEVTPTIDDLVVEQTLENNNTDDDKVNAINTLMAGIDRAMDISRERQRELDELEVERIAAPNNAASEKKAAEKAVKAADKADIDELTILDLKRLKDMIDEHLTESDREFNSNLIQNRRARDEINNRYNNLLARGNISQNELEEVRDKALEENELEYERLVENQRVLRETLDSYLERIRSYADELNVDLDNITLPEIEEVTEIVTEDNENQTVSQEQKDAPSIGHDEEIVEEIKNELIENAERNYTDEELVQVINDITVPERLQAIITGASVPYGMKSFSDADREKLKEMLDTKSYEIDAEEVKVVEKEEEVEKVEEEKLEDKMHRNFTDEELLAIITDASIPYDMKAFSEADREKLKEMLDKRLYENKEEEKVVAEEEPVKEEVEEEYTDGMINPQERFNMTKVLNATRHGKEYEGYVDSEGNVYLYDPINDVMEFSEKATKAYKNHLEEKKEEKDVVEEPTATEEEVVEETKTTPILEPDSELKEEVVEEVKEEEPEVVEEHPEEVEEETNEVSDTYSTNIKYKVNSDESLTNRSAAKNVIAARRSKFSTRMLKIIAAAGVGAATISAAPAAAVVAGVYGGLTAFGPAIETKARLWATKRTLKQMGEMAGLDVAVNESTGEIQFMEKDEEGKLVPASQERLAKADDEWKDFVDAKNHNKTRINDNLEPVTYQNPTPIFDKFGGIPVKVEKQTKVDTIKIVSENAKEKIDNAIAEEEKISSVDLSDSEYDDMITNRSGGETEIQPDTIQSVIDEFNKTPEESKDDFIELIRNADYVSDDIKEKFEKYIESLQPSDKPPVL